MFDWFEDAFQFASWAGPGLTRPDNKRQLQKLISCSPYQSLAIKNKGHLLAFGQLQLIGSRAHLARLAVNPLHRRQGLSLLLVNKIIALAADETILKSVSLFVFRYNKAALGAYQQLGFVETAFPPSIKPIKDCIYMTMHY